MARRWVVLLVAHGTISRLDEIPGFLTEIRRGRPAPQGLIDEMTERYRSIGQSPLLEETQKQAARVGELLGLEARVAMRLWEPRVVDVLKDLGPEDGVCLVPVAPFSVHVYEGAARRALASVDGAPEVICVQPWGDAESLVERWIKDVTESLPSSGGAHVVLTAHSLPAFLIERGDPYARLFEASAAVVAERVAADPRVASVSTCYQSQGATDDAWLGPDLPTTLKGLADTGAKSVVVSPIGFLAEHVETLYDLDIEAAAEAKALGLEYHRAPAVGVGACEAMAEAARRALSAAGAEI